MGKPFYIGTREKMLETRSPTVGFPSSKMGFSNQVNFLNGGASVRRSRASHKRYEMSWDSFSSDEARVILDLADQVYGVGDIFWHDPFVADRNCLPQWWGTPATGLDDGLPLNNGVRGRAVATPTNSLSFPVQSIAYTCAGAGRSVWIPIPVGHTAWVGAYGVNGTGGRVVATPTTGATTVGAATNLRLMAVTNPARFNHSVAASGGFTGVLISLGGTGTVTLSGLMVQVLLDGVTPKTGGFISGQGHSGCQFVAQPDYTPFSYAFDTVGVVAEFVETGGWSQ
jgi:hypothetical protein